jgi:hypothetical protein
MRDIDPVGVSVFRSMRQDEFDADRVLRWSDL